MERADAPPLNPAFEETRDLENVSLAMSQALRPRTYGEMVFVCARSSVRRRAPGLDESGRTSALGSAGSAALEALVSTANDAVTWVPHQCGRG